MDRLEAALDEPAFRLAGKSWTATTKDPENHDIVVKDVVQNFITPLEMADVAALMAPSRSGSSETTL
jgi:hypothetical protein